MSNENIQDDDGYSGLRTALSHGGSVFVATKGEDLSEVLIELLRPLTMNDEKHEPKPGQFLVEVDGEERVGTAFTISNEAARALTALLLDVLKIRFDVKLSFADR